MTNILKAIARIICFRHKNTISVVEDGKYICDKCERCGALLPKAWPYHEEYRRLT